jgi:hypothetical protein
VQAITSRCAPESRRLDSSRGTSVRLEHASKTPRRRLAGRLACTGRNRAASSGLLNIAAPRLTSWSLSIPRHASIYLVAPRFTPPCLGLPRPRLVASCAPVCTSNYTTRPVDGCTHFFCSMLGKHTTGKLRNRSGTPQRPGRLNDSDRPDSIGLQQQSLLIASGVQICQQRWVHMHLSWVPRIYRTWLQGK